MISLRIRPVAAGLIHTLKFVVNEDFANKEWFVVMDDDDLATLQEQITRARTKANSLREMPNNDVPTIT